jgi:hypothetical protein
MGDGPSAGKRSQRTEVVPAPLPAQTAWSQALYVDKKFEETPFAQDSAEIEDGAVQAEEAQQQWRDDTATSGAGENGFRGNDVARIDDVGRARGRGRRGESAGRAGEGGRSCRGSGRSSARDASPRFPGGRPGGSGPDNKASAVSEPDADAVAAAAAATAVAAAAKAAKAMERITMPSVVPPRKASADGSLSGGLRNGASGLMQPALSPSVVARTEALPLYSGYGGVDMPLQGSMHQLGDKANVNIFDGADNGTAHTCITGWKASGKSTKVPCITGRCHNRCILVLS